jgi:hypothetical protein
LTDYLGFSGNEAGDEYYYFNGGIWSQGNAWYALALIQNDQKENAYNFIKNVMTVKGTMNGPNGQPAMYEVRNGNKNNPAEYGTVDKSNFLWAGGWYINTLYNLYLLKENSWNITLNPYNNGIEKEINLSLALNGKLSDVRIKGNGSYVESIKYDGKELPSLVIPAAIKSIENIDIMLSEKLGEALISETNSVLLDAELSGNHLVFYLKAFEGHSNTTDIISVHKPGVLTIDDVLLFKNSF